MAGTIFFLGGGGTKFPGFFRRAKFFFNQRKKLELFFYKGEPNFGGDPFGGYEGEGGAFPKKNLKKKRGGGGKRL